MADRPFVDVVAWANVELTKNAQRLATPGFFEVLTLMAFYKEQRQLELAIARGEKTVNGRAAKVVRDIRHRPLRQKAIARGFY